MTATNPENKTNIPKLYCSKREAVFLNGVKAGQLRKDRHIITFIRKGKNLFFRVKDLIAYMEAGAEKKPDSPDYKPNQSN